MRTARPFARLAALAATPVALLLTACGDAADPTAPGARPALAVAAPTPGPTPPGAGPGPIGPALTVAVTLLVGDQASFTGIAGTTVELKTNIGYKRVVVDNSASDVDPGVGRYRVMMPSAGSYTATVVGMPEVNAAVGTTKTVSAFMTPTWVAMGSIILKRKPALVVKLMKQGAFVWGQTIQVTGPNGFSATVTDGSPADKDALWNPGPSDGVIRLRVPVTGTYTVCATTSPQADWSAGCEQVFAQLYFFAYPVTLTYAQKFVFGTP
jgi:hypothetical protein